MPPDGKASGKLTTTEMKTLLHKDEAIIRESDAKVGAAIVTAGRAFKRIRDQQTYLGDGHHSFAKYMRKVWDWGPSHTYRMITDAVVLEAVWQVVPGLQLIESHLRELSLLVVWDEKGLVPDCSKAVAVVTALLTEVKEDKLTAKFIHKKVALQLPEEKKKPKAKTEAHPSPPKVIDASSAAEVQANVRARLLRKFAHARVYLANEAECRAAEAEERAALRELDSVLKWIKSTIKESEAMLNPAP